MRKKKSRIPASDQPRKKTRHANESLQPMQTLRQIKGIHQEIRYLQNMSKGIGK